MLTVPLILFTGTPFLWLLSLYLLRRWRHFWTYAALNLLVLLGYVTLAMWHYPFGHDEYGLGRMSTLGGAFLVQAILGFVVALSVHLRRLNREV